MRVTEHRPPGYSSIPEADPVILLAGPATPWRPKAIEAFQALPDDDFTLHLADPYQNGGKRLSEAERQDWEDFYLTRATEVGGVLLHFSASGVQRPELAGEAIGMYRADRHVPLVISLESAHKSHLPYINQRARQFDIPVFKRLDHAALALVEQITDQL